MIGERVIGDYRDDLGTYICIAIIEQLEIWRICGKGAYTLSLVWNFRMQDLHFFSEMPTYKTGIGTNAEADEHEDHYELHEKIATDVWSIPQFF